MIRLDNKNVIINAGWFHTLDYKRKHIAKLSDIALLKLDQTIDFKKTNTAQTKLFAPGVAGNNNWYPQERNSIAVGWGLTRWPDSSKELKVAGIRTKSLSWCINKSNQMGFRAGTMTIPDVFCGHGKQSQYSQNRPQICFGDSGGPLFLKYGNELTQVGINVWVDRTCSQNFNGFLRINEHISWLKRHVKVGTPINIVTFQDLDSVTVNGKSDEELMRHFDYDGTDVSNSATVDYDSGMSVEDADRNSSNSNYDLNDGQPYNLDADLDINVEDDYDVVDAEGGAGKIHMGSDGHPIWLMDAGSSISDTQDPFHDKTIEENHYDWIAQDGDPSFVDFDSSSMDEPAQAQATD